MSSCPIRPGSVVFEEKRVAGDLYARWRGSTSLPGRSGRCQHEGPPHQPGRAAPRVGWCCPPLHGQWAHGGEGRYLEARPPGLISWKLPPDDLPALLSWRARKAIVLHRASSVDGIAGNGLTAPEALGNGHDVQGALLLEDLPRTHDRACPCLHSAHHSSPPACASGSNSTVRSRGSRLVASSSW